MTTPSSALLRRQMIANAVGMLLLLVGFVASDIQLYHYENALTRQEFTVSGNLQVPVLAFLPEHPKGDVVAVIVHGYSGNKELMTGFGVELARIGVASFLLDLPGHGAAPNPLLTSTLRDDQLQLALDEVVQYARAHSPVAHPRIVLLGHSLGTAVVGTYALSHPASDLAGTILVSPILQQMPDPDHPNNLLVIVGEGDLSGIVTLAPKIVRAGCGGGRSVDCGTLADGGARRLVVAYGANHITILTDPQAYNAMNQWVAGIANITDVSPVASETRLHWLEFGGLCAILVLFPLLRLLRPLFGDATFTAPPVAAPRAWSSLGWCALAVVVTVFILRGWSLAADGLGITWFRTPLSWLGIQLADYLGSFFLVLAGAMLLIARWRWGRWFLAPPRWEIGAQAIVAVTLLALLYVGLGFFTTHEWGSLALTLPRLGRALFLGVALLPFFLQLEGWFGSDRALLTSAGLRGGVTIVICLGLVGAIVLDSRLFFLSLLIPIAGGLFVLFAAIGLRLRQIAPHSGFASALIAAATLGWVTAAIFPLTV